MGLFQCVEGALFPIFFIFQISHIIFKYSIFDTNKIAYKTNRGNISAPSVDTSFAGVYQSVSGGSIKKRIKSNN